MVGPADQPGCSSPTAATLPCDGLVNQPVCSSPRATTLSCYDPQFTSSSNSSLVLVTGPGYDIEFDAVPKMKHHIDWTAVFPSLVNGEPSAPFSGPHTAIQMPAGPKKGMWLHIPQLLHDKKMTTIISDISAAWKTWEPNNYAPTVGSPEEPYSATDFELLGPPPAPYPMTMSPIQPFKGPHTALFNTGSYFNGWYVHVPQYLAQEEMNRSESQFSWLCEQPWAWGDGHGGDPFRSYQKTHPFSLDVYAAQKRVTALFVKEAGIDFSSQEDFSETWGKGPFL